MNTTVIKNGISALLSLVIAGVCVLAPIMPQSSLAADSGLRNLINANLNTSAQGFQELAVGRLTVEGVIGLVVTTIISVLGLVFLILMVYGGIIWMTAEGDEKKVAKARGIIFHAVIGLIIVMSAYAITAFVIGRLAGVGA